MTTKERVGTIKAFQTAIENVHQSNRDWEKHELYAKVGDATQMELSQRENDLHRGYALGIAAALALIGGCAEQVKAIHVELGE